MSISAFNARLKGPLGMGGSHVVSMTESSFTSMGFSFWSIEFTDLMIGVHGNESGPDDLSSMWSSVTSNQMSMPLALYTDTSDTKSSPSPVSCGIKFSAAEIVNYNILHHNNESP